MKGLKKLVACMCAVVLMVSGIVYYPSNAVKAQTYDQLTYENLGEGVAFCYISNTLSANRPELLDAGQTLQIAYSADNKATDTKVTINGVETSSGTGAVIMIDTAITKLNPTKFDDNAYTHIVITSTTGTAEMVIKRGTPTGGGEIATTGSSPEQTTASGGQGETTAQTPTTAHVPDASSLPKQVLGVVGQTQLGEGADAVTIDNSVMIAWAPATDASNVDGYDPTVTSYNIYIYKNGQQMTRIVNATNGGVIGGLSAGSYQTAVAAVNAKGEGVLSQKVSFTVTGTTLNYTYPVECNGPKTPSGLSIITANPEVQPSVGNETNAIEVAWAASSNAEASSYDPTVAGYNIYLFDAATGNPYRRVYVNGIAETYTAIKTVSAGTYLVYLSAVNANGEESALSAPGISLASKVTVKGETYDNAQDFDYPNQPMLPVGLEIITAGIQYGFTVAWAADANLTGIRLNLYVNGICIKAGINDGTVSSYYENRLVAGTYTIEVKAQYISNNVESFPLTKTGVTIAADPGLTTQDAASLADPNYAGYEKPTEVPTTPSEQETTTKNGSGETTKAPEGGETTVAPTVKPDDPTQASTKPAEETTTQKTQEATTAKPGVVPTKPSETTKTTAVKVAKAKITSASKKKSAKAAKVSIKKIAGITGYQIQISKAKNFKKKNILVQKNVKKASFTISSKKIKNKGTLYVRARALKTISGKTYYGAWSTAKKIKIKK